MMQSMTTEDGSVGTLFNHQMIPHHQNAVNMAKSFLKLVDPVCNEGGGVIEEGAVVPWECEMIPVLYDIINTQNSQILDMQGVLADEEEEQYADCVVDMSGIDLDRRLTQAEKTSRRTTTTSVFVSGQTCIPCEHEAITDECEIKMK